MKIEKIKEKWSTFEQGKIYRSLFYKTEVPLDKIRKEWAFRPMKTLPTPGMFRRFSEITWGMTATAAIASLLLSSTLVWSIHFPYFEVPPTLNTIYNSQEVHIDSSVETHVPAWIKLAFFELTGPLHSRLDHEQLNAKYPDIMAYKYYLSLVSQVGLTYLLWLRFLMIAAATSFAGFVAFRNSHRFLFKTEFIIESEGARVFEGPEAERELAKFWEPAYSTFDKECSHFANIGENIYHPEDQRRQHTLLIGNSGSGKSQVLQEFVYSSINAGLKTVLLDPKSEWTKNLFDENDPSIALIDPTDARSHVWLFMEDLKGIGFITSFIASVIPSGGDQNKMWTNAARMVNVALFLFIKKIFGDSATFKDVADTVQLDDTQIAHIVNEFYPHASRLVGELKENGVEQNVTASGIMINMISFMEYFMDLARYWNKPSDKTISLYKFMTDPDYPIKTIIIRPNETESRLARGITANVLAYMMNFIKKPELYGDSEKPVGNFILDEFQSPGKLEDENNDPVLQTVIQQARSFGWGLFFATQTLPEAERIYGKEVIAGWRGTIGTQILAGAPTDSLQPWIDGFGDKKIQKYHLSQSTASNGEISYSANWQEHISKAMLPGTLASKLKNQKPWVKFLIVPVGAENLYFIRKKFKKITVNFPSFVRADEQTATIKKDSRVLVAVNAIVKNKDPVAALENSHKSAASRFDEIINNEEHYEEILDARTSSDKKKYAEDALETEATINVKFKKEYDITPDKEDEDSLDGDIIKDKAVEILTDTHAINVVRQILELMNSNSKNRVKATNYQEKVKFEQKKRYGNACTGLELKRDKEIH